MKLEILSSGSKGNSYILDDGDELLLLEAGIKAKEIIRAIGSTRLSRTIGCLISHEHQDHACAAGRLSTNYGIDLYASAGTLSKIKAPQHRQNAIKHNCTTSIGEYDVLPYSVIHDAAEPFGFMIRHKDMGKLLFATDTVQIPYLFKGIDHLMIEINYSDEKIALNESSSLSVMKRTKRNHMSLETARKWIQCLDKSTLKTVTIIHVSPSNGEPERFERELQEITGVPCTVVYGGEMFYLER